MGLGLLGRGAGDAEFLVQCGAEVTITDTKSKAELKYSVERLAPYSDITYHLGGHVMEDFTDCDMVIKGAGVPLNSPFITAAKTAGIPVYMSTALFAQFAHESGALVIGVTGTRGKSTITHLIQHTLAHAKRESKIGGNVRGVSTLAFLPGVKKGDFFVLELDSWQLQGFGDLQISPHIAVVSNLMPDHLNYYPDMDTYFYDKAHIFLHQKPGDFLFVGASIVERVQAAHPQVEAIVPPPVPEEWKVQILGEHNRINIALAAAALRAAGLSEDEIQRGVETFFGVEGRLQLVREVRGIKIYNDNNATTPEATLAALSALSVESTILLMGGSDKGLPLEVLAQKAKQCKRVVLIPGTGTARIESMLPFAIKADTFEGAVRLAIESALPGDTMLFSPAFASFGLFKNEYERNDQFLHIVRAL